MPHTYYYALQAYASPGSGFGDNSVVYRNFNDSCAYVDIYHTHWTKSIYADANGNWLVWYEDNNNCGLGSKAHLNPSSDYGYTYVQAKCTNPSAHNSATFQSELLDNQAVIKSGVSQAQIEVRHNHATNA